MSCSSSSKELKGEEGAGEKEAWRGVEKLRVEGLTKDVAEGAIANVINTWMGGVLAGGVRSDYVGGEVESGNGRKRRM